MGKLGRSRGAHNAQIVGSNPTTATKLSSPREAHGMDAGTLSTAMGGVLPFSRYQELVGPMNNAMIAANCTNINRAAMWVAQIGHESVSLKYMEEIASGAAYEGRHDLGNVIAGDGKRFKGRGPIQLTGRGNYAAFGRWAASRGYVSDPNIFVDNPFLLSNPHWGFLAATYYWVVARADLNLVSDQGDVRAATLRINGGTNGLADRTLRWNRCRPLGYRLLPTPQEVPDLDTVQAKQLADVFNYLNNEQRTLDKDLRWSSKVERDALDAIKANGETTNDLLRQLLAKP